MAPGAVMLNDLGSAPGKSRPCAYRGALSEPFHGVQRWRMVEGLREGAGLVLFATQWSMHSFSCRPSSTDLV